MKLVTVADVWSLIRRAGAVAGHVRCTRSRDFRRLRQIHDGPAELGVRNAQLSWNWSGEFEMRYSRRISLARIVVDGTTETDLPQPARSGVTAEQEQFHGRWMQVPLRYGRRRRQNPPVQTCSRGQQSVNSPSSRLTFPPFITTTTSHSHLTSRPLSPPAPRKPSRPTDRSPWPLRRW
jgi:hypothetical protein